MKLIETENFFLFFGNRHHSLESMQKKFPHFQWAKIKQVHGNELIYSDKESLLDLKTADAHWTKTAGLSLCISTADCVPILIFSETERWALAIHAGWRGVAARITAHSLLQLQKQGLNVASAQVVLGPHIQQSSFEVDLDVKNQLLESCKAPHKKFFTTEKNGKFLVGLADILISQLSEFGISRLQIGLEKEDTKTDPNFYSFRRDRQEAGRNLSFIVIKNVT